MDINEPYDESVNFLEESQQTSNKRKKRKTAEINKDEKTPMQGAYARERKRKQNAKNKSERKQSERDPLELVEMSSPKKECQNAEEKPKETEERKRLRQLRKKKREEMTEAEKIEIRKYKRERKRRQRQKLKEDNDDDDIASFPLWIQQEIDELEKELNVRPRKIKLWQMTEEQLEEKRKYEREKQRRQRAKIKAQKSVYDPLDLLQRSCGNEDYDDDNEGSVQHLWRPDVE